MVLIDPLRQRRRQQERLLAIALNETLGHTGMVLNAPDDTDLPDSHRCSQQSSSAASIRYRADVARRPTSVACGEGCVADADRLA